MKTLNNIERFEAVVKNGAFTMNEELSFVKILIEKYNFISPAQYAKKEGVSNQGVMSRLKAKNDPYLYLAGRLIIIK